MTKAMSIHSRPFSIRTMLLAGALALLLLPFAVSRASAAGTYGVHHYCAASASSNQSTWVPPNSYCQRGTGGQPAQLVGSFTSNEVGGSRTNQRRCAIIDVYSTVSGLQVKRYKACTVPGEWSKTVRMTNGEYLNQNKYIMFAYVYNGSSTRLNLGGTAFGYRY